jgi:hypothetical protein
MCVPPITEVTLQDADTEEGEDEKEQSIPTKTVYEGLAEAERVKHDEANNPTNDGVPRSQKEAEQTHYGQPGELPNAGAHVRAGKQTVKGKP